MDINHLHLAGRDVGALARFYETWFGFRKVSDHGDGLFLRNDAGFLLVLDRADAPQALPDWFHFGFCLTGPEDVRTCHARMKEAGVAFAMDLVDLPGEACAFYCLDPAGTRVEVSWHLKDD